MVWPIHALHAVRPLWTVELWLVESKHRSTHPKRSESKRCCPINVRRNLRRTRHIRIRVHVWTDRQQTDLLRADWSALRGEPNCDHGDSRQSAKWKVGTTLGQTGEAFWSFSVFVCGCLWLRVCFCFLFCCCVPCVIQVDHYGLFHVWTCMANDLHKKATTERRHVQLFGQVNSYCPMFQESQTNKPECYVGRLLWVDFGFYRTEKWLLDTHTCRHAHIIHAFISIWLDLGFVRK